VRLDIFLKRTGLLKQRTAAKETCDEGRVRVGGCAAKAGREIGAGDIVTLDTPVELVEIEILDLPDRNCKRKDGQAFYRIREQRPKDRL
jgi:ribosomal 50S subunit-recycling heat shock protein